MDDWQEHLERDRETLTRINEHATEAALPLAQELSHDIESGADVQNWFAEFSGALLLLGEGEHAVNEDASRAHPNGRRHSPLMKAVRRSLTDAKDGWNGGLDKNHVRLRAFRLGQDFLSAWLEPVLDIAEEKNGGLLWENLMPIDQGPLADIQESLLGVRRKHAIEMNQLTDYLRRFKQNVFGNRDYAELPGEAGMLKTFPGNSAEEHKVFVAGEALISSWVQDPDMELAQSMAESLVSDLHQLHIAGPVMLPSLSSLGLFVMDQARFADRSSFFKLFDAVIPSGSAAAPSFLLACAESRLFDDVSGIAFEASQVALVRSDLLNDHPHGFLDRGPRQFSLVPADDSDRTQLDYRRVSTDEVAQAFADGMVTWRDASRDLGILS